MERNELARKLVTSLIEANVTADDVGLFVKKVKKYPFYGIAVDLPYLESAKRWLEGTDIRLGTVAGYPLGGMTSEVKIRQTEYAIERGVDEIDISMNYNAIKSGDFDRVLDEVKRMREVVEDRIEVLMIPQTHILTNEEKIKVLKTILEGGIRMIKTNSGFGWNTTFEDIALINREFKGEFVRIDVSGGVRTAEQALEFLRLGGHLVHTSTPEKILEGIQ